MTLNKKSFVEIITRHYVVTILVVTILTWFPVLLVSFINDDIQILRFLKGNNLGAIFQPFYTPDVSGYYWRPIGNMIHPIILLIAGFNPFLFRLVSLLTYSLCTILLFNASKRIGIERRIGILITIIFAIVPSHELQITWIADQGESLLLIFLLLSFINYSKIYGENKRKIKNSILAIVWFLFAILTKEAAFSGIFIPFIVLVSQKDYKKNRILKALRDTGIGILIIILTLSYRYIFIGGTPFSSDHFAGITVLKSVANFFIYIPLAFIPPEALEWLQSISNNPVILILLITISLSLIVFFINKAQKLNKLNFNIILTGMLWYVVFIMPAVTKLMRWYVFVASIGLFWIIAAYIQNWKKFFLSKKILVVIILLISGTAIYDFNLMIRWSNASKIFGAALNSVEKYTNEISSDSLLIWITPDKIDRIPLMKLGIQQSFQWKLKNDNIDVSAPFRVEMVNSDSHIKMINQTDSTIIFKISNGRFLPQGGKSHYIIRNENMDGQICNINYTITTRNIGNMPTSILEVRYLKNQIPHNQLYFNGKDFIKIR